MSWTRGLVRAGSALRTAGLGTPTCSRTEKVFCVQLTGKHAVLLIRLQSVVVFADQCGAPLNTGLGLSCRVGPWHHPLVSRGRRASFSRPGNRHRVACRGYHVREAQGMRYTPGPPSGHWAQRRRGKQEVPHRGMGCGKWRVRGGLEPTGIEHLRGQAGVSGVTQKGEGVPLAGPAGARTDQGLARSGSGAHK